MKLFIKGAVFGTALGVLGSAMITPKLLIKEKASPLGYEETLAHIQHNATNADWKVSTVMKMDKTLAKEGKSVLPAASLKICRPDYAETMLQDDDARFLTVMMPCSVAVYEKADGKTYISTMNWGLLGRMFGGTAQKVMGGPVAREAREFVQF